MQRALNTIQMQGHSDDEGGEIADPHEHPLPHQEQQDAVYMGGRSAPVSRALARAWLPRASWATTFHARKITIRVGQNSFSLVSLGRVEQGTEPS